MQINNSNNAYMNNTKGHISFGAGKVKLWLDSDGTYFPDNDQTILFAEKRNTERFSKVKQTFEQLNNFIQKFQQSIELNISTGRNRGEYKHFLNLVKEAGLNFIRPDRLVIKNGGDVFLSKPLNNNYDSTLQQDWPSDRFIDKAKREDIKKQSNWEAGLVQSAILESLEEWDFPVIIAPSGLGSYGSKSYHNIWKAVKEKENNSWTAFIRQDGALGFYVGFPIDKSANNLTNTIIKSIKEKLDDKNISYDLSYNETDWENSYAPAIVITPVINGKKLNKTYDIAKELEKAKKDNDLIIIAGNGPNDLEMLDPSSYSKLGDLANLPLMSIVVSDASELNDLAKNNPSKVIEVGQYGLLEGIKNAIKIYSQKNDTFKQNLAPELIKEVLQ